MSIRPDTILRNKSQKQRDSVSISWKKDTTARRIKIGHAHKGLVHTDKAKKKISLAQIGRKLSIETREKMSRVHKERGTGKWMRGKKLTPEHRKKIGESLKGEKSHFWKNGVTALNKIIRCSTEYKLWREAVFKRDNYTCKFCGKIGGELNADHIKSFAYFPELRFAIDNGRALCRDCHRKTDTYGNKNKKI